jgi:hypothetical protein
MYQNETYLLHEDCFGPKYVEKINEFKAMTIDGFWNNWILELSIMYQLYYMWGEKCKIDMTFNDLYIYCWNEGCEIEQIGEHLKKNFLYMTRALIDAGIVWWEGVPNEKMENLA